MKVLLTQDVRKLGWLGDVVEVADGYARNFLFPQGLAKGATEDNIRAISKQKAQRAEQRKLEREQLERVAKAVDGAEVVIAAAANEQGHLFGAVHAKDIAGNLRGQGFEVKDEAVELGENIKAVGTQKVRLWFDEGLTATVTVTVIAAAGEGMQQSEQVGEATPEQTPGEVGQRQSGQ